MQEDFKAAIIRYYWMQGMISFAIAGSYGLGLFFIPLGILLLGLAKIMSIPIDVLTSYTSTFLYIITPLRGILNNLPKLAKISAALDKLEFLELALKTQLEEP